MAVCTRATIRVVIQHRQENHHQYPREDKPDNLVDVASEPRVRITIGKDVAAGIDIARKNLLMTTNENHPRSIWQSKI
jgi:hypothetical protein